MPPRTVKIRKAKYKITTALRGSHYGEFTSSPRLITLNTKHPDGPEHLPGTLLHEILHAIIHEYSSEYNIRCNERTEEKIVQALERGLIEISTDSPKIIDYIFGPRC